MKNRRGQLYIISAPSGTGKTTLCNMLLADNPDLSYSVSYTTRLPRKGEVDGVNYHFVDKEVFQALQQKGDFLEYAVVHDNYYATSKSAIAKQLETGDVILDIDVQGAMQVKELVGDAIFIYIAPPSFSALRVRLCGRGDTDEAVVERRLKNACEELTYMPRYDYIVVNDYVESAYEKLSAIYKASSCSAKLVLDYSKIVDDN